MFQLLLHEAKNALHKQDKSTKLNIIKAFIMYLDGMELKYEVIVTKLG